MEKGLVSIIMPCFNGEKFLERTFKCYLEQTYKKFEIFFIDDGSSDSTKNICEKYKELFEKQNIKFYYYFQENKGQAAAINSILKKINGEFLTWPDSDDLITKDSINERVNFFNESNNSKYGFVRNAVEIRNFETEKKIGEFRIKNEKEKIFEDILYDTANIFWAPVSYMVKVNSFKEVNPKMEIYESRGGQNIQMLLPIAYKSKCGYIDKILSIYYVRKKSHSREKFSSMENLLENADIHKDILLETLKEMGVEREYKENVDNFINLKKWNIAYKYNEKKLEKKYFRLLLNKNALSNFEKIKYFVKSNMVLNYIYINLRRKK